MTFTDPNGVLDGKQLVDSNVGPDATDSDAVGDVEESVIEGITVVAGEDTPDNDAGAENIPTSSVGGTVFMDNNDNSVEDAGDMTLEGVQVQLFQANVGLVATTMTDANGDYLFEDVTPGTGFRVQFENVDGKEFVEANVGGDCLLYTSPSPRDQRGSRMPSSA